MGIDSAVHEPSSRERELLWNLSILEDARETLKYAGQVGDVRFDMGRGALKQAAQLIKPPGVSFDTGYCLRLRIAIGVQEEDNIQDEELIQLAVDCAHVLEVTADGETVPPEELRLTDQLLEKLELFVHQDIQEEQISQMRAGNIWH